MSSFEEIVCVSVRRHLRRPVRLPDVGKWGVVVENGVTVLELIMPAGALARNFQTSRAAAPWFLVCFAYWYEQVTGIEPALRLCVEGAVPTDAGEVRHYRRAWIALEALEHALGDRLQVVGAPQTRWPRKPVMNAPTQLRSKTPSKGGKSEHRIEVQFTADASIAADFSERFEPIDHFRRQLPLGLFDGVVSNPTRWTPGNGAQADLWATSLDGSAFHLFELKVRGNAQVGVLPELLGYLWLLHRARAGFSDGRAVQGGGPGYILAVAIKAERHLGSSPSGKGFQASAESCEELVGCS